jgi:hypothetical protein
MRSERCLTLLTLTLCILPYSLQARAEGCDDVYLNSIRNKYNSIEDYASYNALYDQICNADGERKNLSWESSMGIVIDAIPINMTGNGKSSEEKASSFCHFYHDVRYDSSHVAVSKDEVVVTALSNYNTCKEIESKTGVVVTHKFADPDSIVVNFEFKNTSTFLRIDGVLANNMACRSNNAPWGQAQLSDRSHFEMRENFAITCARTHPRENRNAYLPGSLAIGTNISSYTISMPADSIYDDRLASETSSKIAGLNQSFSETQKKLSETKEKLSQATNKISGLHMVQHRVMTGTWNPGGGYEFYPCYTKLDQVQDSLCKGAYKATTTPSYWRDGETCGYHSYVITCLYLGE